MLLALGRHAEARAAAEAELAVAAGRGVAGALARAQLGLALTLDGPQMVEQLRIASQTVRESPSPRLQAEVVGEYGAALRRSGQRSRAREPLSEARERAHRCSATGLEQRYLDELLVAGARPQRVALAGVDSLTTAERRVAELAADGMRNREIAETLFVTLKTVEVHLGRVYAKLSIHGRAQLADALDAT